MEIIQPKEMDVPKGHYSPGISHNGVIYVSGQLPITPAGSILTGDIEEQTTCCLENIRNILEAGGSGLQSVLKLTIFVSDISDWPVVNKVVAAIMGDHRPARIVVPVKQLNYGCAIEIDAIAAKG